MKTFVDDSLIKVNKIKDENFQTTIENIMSKVEDYTAANKLCLNPDKTKVMLVTKDKTIKDEFQVTLKGKLIKHSKEINLLGITVEENLMWDNHVKKT